jgi:hypothetical protein
MHDDLDKVEGLVAQVLQAVREAEVDFRIRYETQYYKDHPGDTAELHTLMVAKALESEEAKFLLRAVETLGPIPTHIRFMVMRRVKEERAPRIRKNPHHVLRRKTYQEVKVQNEKMQKQATRRLRLDDEKKRSIEENVPLPPRNIKPKPMQLVFGDLIDEVDRK